jgi:hypothetical protein
MPDGRYAQWRATIHPGAALSGVGLNYLPRNVAPVIDDLVVATGARVAASSTPAPSQTVQIAFPSANSAPTVNLGGESGTAPLSAQKDKTSVTVRWSARDDNGDELIFSVWYRGEDEQTWRLLKDKVADRFYSFDSALLPDGHYLAKVTASDAPSHIAPDTLTAERASAAFTLDTTPPVPGPLTATVQSGKIHATFAATDATSPIAHAEFSVDGGPWQYLEPVGKLSDSLTERYDFVADAPTAGASPEHTLAVRVFDRFENAVTAKTVVR